MATTTRRYTDEPVFDISKDKLADDSILLVHIGTGIRAIKVGELRDFLQGKISDLSTADKTSVVAAVNELVTAKDADEKDIDDIQDVIINYKNAGVHNAIYRGKNLGESFTDQQSAAIQAGTFDDLYVGDYWVIGGVTYRIAAFDYYLTTGDTACNTHHVVIVPDEPLYSARMNASNVTTGAYVGSEMYTSNLNQAKTTIRNAFGASHILTHRNHLQNAVTNGYPSGGTWYDSQVELMTEQNVYGCKIFGSMANGSTIPNNYVVDKSQYPLFAHRPDLISNRHDYWLRDTVSATFFALVAHAGVCGSGGASSASLGVRPAFSVI